MHPVMSALWRIAPVVPGLGHELPMRTAMERVPWLN